MSLFIHELIESQTGYLLFPFDVAEARKKVIHKKPLMAFTVRDLSYYESGDVGFVILAEGCHDRIKLVEVEPWAEAEKGDGAFPAHSPMMCGKPPR